MSEATHRKVFDVLDAGLSGLEIAHKAGVEIALGSDLLGALQIHQSEELLLRAEVQPPLDVIRSATTVGARLLGEEGRLGVVAVGALADLLAVDGNPLEDISVLTRPTMLALVMRGGIPVKAP
jgi:imidazolonepropionase-like amidohydrolase